MLCFALHSLSVAAKDASSASRNGEPKKIPVCHRFGEWTDTERKAWTSICQEGKYVVTERDPETCLGKTVISGKFLKDILTTSSFSQRIEETGLVLSGVTISSPLEIESGKVIPGRIVFDCVQSDSLDLAGVTISGPLSFTSRKLSKIDLTVSYLKGYCILQAAT